MMDVLVVGTTAVDVIATPVEKLPAKGSNALFDRYEILGGGNAGNTAMVLSRLGMKVGISTAVGQDAFGDMAISWFDVAKINRSAVLQLNDQPTACTLVFVPEDGDRRMLHCPGAMNAFSDQSIPDDLLQQSRHLHVASFLVMPNFNGESLTRLLKRAKQLGLTTSVDPAVNHQVPDWSACFKRALPFIDLFFPSEEEAQKITNEREPKKMVALLRKQGVPVVGIKLGAKGCVVGYEDEYHEIDPVAVEAKDTCGAGDAFYAGFLSQYLRGKPLKEAALFANATGALCVSAIGATTGVESTEQVEMLLQR